MIGLDTNILVRYLVQDDPDQSRLANQQIERVRASGDKCLIDTIVLCETTWVLESSYEYERGVIGTVVEKILMTEQFETQDSDLVWAALEDFRKSKADFADCLIGRTNRSLKCSETITFDWQLKGLSGFRVL